MGLGLMLIGLLGFLPNPLIGLEGFFRTNAVLNFIIMGHAAALLFAATRESDAALQGLYLVAVSALGFGWFFSTHLVHQPARRRHPILVMAPPALALLQNRVDDTPEIRRLRPQR